MYMNSSGLEGRSARKAQEETLGEPSGRSQHPIG
jgi:hypothetical protein